MDLEVFSESETRFRSYVDALSSVIGHADRKRPLEDYCMGLMGPSERKSVEPIAAVTAPGRTAAQHQSLLHFVGESNRSDEKVLAKVREMVLAKVREMVLPADRAARSTTMRRRIAAALTQRLPRCPCCGRQQKRLRRL